MSIKRWGTAGLLAAALMSATTARADAPSLSSYVWNMPALGLSDCMARAAQAVRQMGVSDVRQSTAADGLGFVDGLLGDYHLAVICLTAKGAVITTVAGVDYTTAGNYRQQIDNNMGNGR